MKSGIYLIQCFANGKCYIGQSKNIEIRLKEHFNKLKNRKHNNKKLQNAFDKYGKDKFISSICIECKINELDFYEKFYIKLFNSLNFGFNIEDGGNLNKTLSEETKTKISISKKGKPNKLKGRKFSEELKKKLSLAHLGLTSSRKGIKTNKPSWNSGKRGLQISSKRIRVQVFDKINNIYLGEFESKQRFLDTINYKSKNFNKISETETKIGRYILKSI